MSFLRQRHAAALLVLVVTALIAACGGPPAAPSTATPATATPGLAETVGAAAARAETAEALAAAAGQQAAAAQTAADEAGRQAATAQALAALVATAQPTPSSPFGGNTGSTTTLGLPTSIAIVVPTEGEPQLHAFPIGHAIALTPPELNSLVADQNVELVFAPDPGSAQNLTNDLGITQTLKLFYDETGPLNGAQGRTGWQWTTFTGSATLSLESGGTIAGTAPPAIRTAPLVPLSTADSVPLEPTTLRRQLEAIAQAHGPIAPLLIVVAPPEELPSSQLYTLIVVTGPISGALGDQIAAWCANCVSGYCKLFCP